jgi:hypothetical protein
LKLKERKKSKRESENNSSKGKGKEAQLNGGTNNEINKQLKGQPIYLNALMRP